MSIILPTCVLFQLVVGTDLALWYWPEIILSFHGHSLFIRSAGCIAKFIIDNIVNHVGTLNIEISFILVSQLMITFLPYRLAELVFGQTGQWSQVSAGADSIYLSVGIGSRAVYLV